MNYNRIFFSLKNRCRIKTQFFLSLKMDILKTFIKINGIQFHSTLLKLFTIIFLKRDR